MLGAAHRAARGIQKVHVESITAIAHLLEIQPGGNVARCMCRAPRILAHNRLPATGITEVHRSFNGPLRQRANLNAPDSKSPCDDSAGQHVPGPSSTLSVEPVWLFGAMLLLNTIAVKPPF